MPGTSPDLRLRAHDAEPPRNRGRILVPVPPNGDPGESTAYSPEDEIARDQARLDELDEQLVCLLVSRIRQARRHQLKRRAAGLPAANLSWERATAKQYVAGLGQDGGEIARAILALSRPTAPPLRVDLPEQDESQPP